MERPCGVVEGECVDPLSRRRVRRRWSSLSDLSWLLVICVANRRFSTPFRHGRVPAQLEKNAAAAARLLLLSHLLLPPLHCAPWLVSTLLT